MLDQQKKIVKIDDSTLERPRKSECGPLVPLGQPFSGGPMVPYYPMYNGYCYNPYQYPVQVAPYPYFPPPVAPTRSGREILG